VWVGEDIGDDKITNIKETRETWEPLSALIGKSRDLLLVDRQTATAPLHGLTQTIATPPAY
jgi:hypothetical protein